MEEILFFQGQSFSRFKGGGRKCPRIYLRRKSCEVSIKIYQHVTEYQYSGRRDR